MERELATMAGWKDMPDDPTFWQRAIDAVESSKNRSHEYMIAQRNAGT